MIKIEKINFKGWPNSYRISNGEVEVIITSDIGPRIMRYAFTGELAAVRQTRVSWFMVPRYSNSRGSYSRANVRHG